MFFTKIPTHMLVNLLERSYKNFLCKSEFWNQNGCRICKRMSHICFRDYYDYVIFRFHIMNKCNKTSDSDGHPKLGPKLGRQLGNFDNLPTYICTWESYYCKNFNGGGSSAVHILLYYSIHNFELIWIAPIHSYSCK